MDLVYRALAWRFGFRILAGFSHTVGNATAVACKSTTNRRTARDDLDFFANAEKSKSAVLCWLRSYVGATLSSLTTNNHNRENIDSEVIMMNSNLSTVLKRIGEKYEKAISNDSRFYIEVGIGQLAEELGYTDIQEQYRDIYALVPLKRPVDGMKVRVDGRTFVNYDQFESGVIVPNYIAQEAGLPYKTFIPNDSMIRNFA